MHPYLVIYLVLVGTGLTGAFLVMLRTGKRRHPILKKSLFYIPIASLVLLSVMYSFFSWILVIILLGIWTELFLVLFRHRKQMVINLVFMAIFSIISFGIFRFSLLASQDQLLFLILAAGTGGIS